MHEMDTARVCSELSRRHIVRPLKSSPWRVYGDLDYQAVRGIVTLQTEMECPHGVWEERRKENAKRKQVSSQGGQTPKPQTSPTEGEPFQRHATAQVSSIYDVHEPEGRVSADEDR